MHYKFPIIKTIDDVLPSIKDRDDFKIIEKDHYTVIDYVYIEPDSFDDIMRRECRGITFDKQGKLIARPFQKFFNLGEREETQPHVIDFSKEHEILKKMDGSLIKPCVVNNELVFMTRKGVTDVALQAWDECAPTPRRKEWMIDWIQDGYTLLFEFVSPKNKIVIEYDEARLVLLAIRHNETGEYITTRSSELDTNLFFNNAKQLQEHVKDIEDIEGYVVRFEDGHMIKIKTDQYVRLHRVIDLFDSEKNILQLILNNDTDDLYHTLDEHKKNRLIAFERDIKKRIKSFARIIETGVDILKDKSQKDFAIWVQEEIEPIFQSVYYQTRKNNKPYENVTKLFLRITTTSTKIEQYKNVLYKAERRWKDY